MTRADRRRALRAQRAAFRELPKDVIRQLPHDVFVQVFTDLKLTRPFGHGRDPEKIPVTDKRARRYVHGVDRRVWRDHFRTMDLNVFLRSDSRHFCPGQASAKDQPTQGPLTAAEALNRAKEQKGSMYNMVIRHGVGAVTVTAKFVDVRRHARAV